MFSPMSWALAKQAEIHITELVLTPGDVLLLCTDGVHNVLEHETLCQLLSQPHDVRTIAENVIAGALARKTRDNVTALVVRCEGIG